MSHKYVVVLTQKCIDGTDLKHCTFPGKIINGCKANCLQNSTIYVKESIMAKGP